jgi:hypothetical protein
MEPRNEFRKTHPEYGESRGGLIQPQAPIPVAPPVPAESATRRRPTVAVVQHGGSIPRNGSVNKLQKPPPCFPSVNSLSLPNQRGHRKMCRVGKKIFLRHKTRNADTPVASPRFPRNAASRREAAQLQDQTLQALAVRVRMCVGSIAVRSVFELELNEQVEFVRAQNAVAHCAV